jgi:hypothetical protein
VTDERAIERLIVHLRAQVAELRRMERDGASTRDIEQSRRMVLRLKSYLADAVVELVSVPPVALAPRPTTSG